MAATKVDLTTNPECCLSADQTAVEIDQVMTAALTGDAKEKTVVEHVRDSTGKLVSVIIDFKDAPASDKRSAEEAIARNNGVATVQAEPEIQHGQNFDGFAAGALPDHEPQYPFTSTYISAEPYARFGAGASSLITGTPAASQVIEANGFSTPNSLEQKIVLAGGEAGQVGMFYNGQSLPGAGGSITDFLFRFRFKLPTGLLGIGPAGRGAVASVNFVDLVQRYVGGRGEQLRLSWFEATDPVTPPTPWSAGGMFPTGAGGTFANLSIPVDGNWHTLEILRTTVQGEDVGLDISLDAVTESFVFPGFIGMAVPREFSVGFQVGGNPPPAGPATWEVNLDDIELRYKLV